MPTIVLGLVAVFGLRVAATIYKFEAMVEVYHNMGVIIHLMARTEVRKLQTSDQKVNLLH